MNANENKKSGLSKVVAIVYGNNHISRASMETTVETGKAPVLHVQHGSMEGAIDNGQTAALRMSASVIAQSLKQHETGIQLLIPDSIRQRCYQAQRLVKDCEAGEKVDISEIVQEWMEDTSEEAGNVFTLEDGTQVNIWIRAIRELVAALKGAKGKMTVRFAAQHQLDFFEVWSGSEHGTLDGYRKGCKIEFKLKDAKKGSMTVGYLGKKEVNCDSFFVAPGKYPVSVKKLGKNDVFVIPHVTRDENGAKLQDENGRPTYDAVITELGKYVLKKAVAQIPSRKIIDVDEMMNQIQEEVTAL